MLQQPLYVDRSIQSRGNMNNDSGMLTVRQGVVPPTLFASSMASAALRCVPGSDSLVPLSRAITLT
jgi:hypothetical protein